jgi:hypothetical protein
VEVGTFLAATAWLLGDRLLIVGVAMVTLGCGFVAI